jgi:basic amino acid/polyamine antiporter, APA family
MSNNTKIGVATATIVGMNAMIGSGIFSIPASLAGSAGPAGILTTIFVAFAVWFLASSMARLAYLYPQEGSFYNYAKQWGGHTMGVLSSGAYLVGLLIAMGLLSQMSGVYLQHYFPSFDAQTLGFCILLGLTILNAIGLVISEIGQYVLIFCTVSPLVITIIMSFTKANLDYLVPFAPFGAVSAIQATRVVIFAFFGFECAASLFNIVENPEKNVPKALTYSLTLVSILYILFAAGIILSTPLAVLTDPKMPLSQILINTFPHQRWVIELIHISTLSAILGTIHSMIWSSSSLLISFVKSLKNKFAQNLIGQKFLSPRTSVITIGALIFASFATLKNLNLFFSLTAAFIVFAFSSSMITLLTLNKEWENKQNIKTIIGLITAFIIWAFAIEGIITEISKLI